MAEISAETGARRRIIGHLAEPAGPRGLFGDALRWRGARMPRVWRLSSTALLGMLVAAGVGYLTSRNPHAAPAHGAVELRVIIIATLVAAGVYAQIANVHARMGPLLVFVGLYASVWLLNGSTDRVAFSVAVLVSSAAPSLFYYVILAHPDGHLHSDAERRLVVGTGAVMVSLWTILVLTSAQPAFTTPLISCAPHCPHNALFLGFTLGDVAPVLKPAIWVAWATLAFGTPLLLIRRGRSMSRRLHRVLIPAELAAIASAGAWAGFVATQSAGSASSGAFGTAYVAVAAVIPGAILLGLFLERRSIAPGLAAFVNQLALRPSADPQALMRSTLNDPSLTIVYYAPGLGAYVDSSGMEVDLPGIASARAVAAIDDGHVPVAAVIYDATLVEQAKFVRAAGAVAILHLQRAQLEADLKASTKALQASRLRLMDASIAERQRIERDLHDGIQQQLVALRLKLELASEAVREEPPRGHRMLASLGRQMDELLATLRLLARGIYPQLLNERGLPEALKSAGRGSPLPVSVDARGIGRHPEEVEVAVYFCCLEALQNAVKHAGAEATVAIRLWRQSGRLCFEVRDTGTGFEQDRIEEQHGLLNMRDRIEAVNGVFSVASRHGGGTTVWGTIPAP
jgi:signal transduction histidine kinase